MNDKKIIYSRINVKLQDNPLKLLEPAECFIKNSKNMIKFNLEHKI